nr:hypothetical protein [Agromyces agglutinans]
MPREPRSSDRSEVEQVEQHREFRERLRRGRVDRREGPARARRIAVAQRTDGRRLQQHDADGVARDVVEVARDAQALLTSRLVDADLELGPQAVGSQDGVAIRAVVRGPLVTREGGESDEREAHPHVLRHVDGDPGERDEGEREHAGPRNRAARHAGRPREQDDADQAPEEERRTADRGEPHDERGAAGRGRRGPPARHGADREPDRDDPGRRGRSGRRRSDHLDDAGGEQRRRDEQVEKPPDGRGARPRRGRVRRFRPQEPEQPPQFGDGLPAARRDRCDAVGVEVDLGGRGIRAHALDRIAQQREHLSAEPSPLVGDHTRRDRGGVGRLEP